MYLSFPGNRYHSSDTKYPEYIVIVLYRPTCFVENNLRQYSVAYYEAKKDYS